MNIGDIVICNDDSGHETFQGTKSSLKRGREYIIYQINECKCGKILYDVGITFPSNRYFTTCKDCKSDIDHGTGTWWCGARRFSKRETKSEVQYVKLEVKIEEPIMN